MTAYNEQVLRTILRYPGITSIQLAELFPVDDPLYGRQRDISRRIQYLREQGFLEDCPRCETCGKAQSRGLRNVVLIPTRKAKTWLKQK